tara:strand:+ start:923 stop:1384 length:462 start_codon:yes stop_codon:yes gene_type:complete
MRYTIEFKGKRSKTMCNMVKLLIDFPNISTTEIVDRLNNEGRMGKNHSVTVNQVANWLPRWGCFVKTGVISTIGTLGARYDVTTWKVNLSFLKVKLGITSDEAEAKIIAKPFGNIFILIIDDESKTYQCLRKIFKEDWDETKKELEAFEKSDK